MRNFFRLEGFLTENHHTSQTIPWRLQGVLSPPRPPGPAPARLAQSFPGPANLGDGTCQEGRTDPSEGSGPGRLFRLQDQRCPQQGRAGNGKVETLSAGRRTCDEDIPPGSRAQEAEALLGGPRKIRLPHRLVAIVRHREGSPACQVRNKAFQGVPFDLCRPSRAAETGRYLQDLKRVR